MNKSELKEILYDNILKYWKTNLLDSENGGFYGRIAGDETRYNRAHKGIILNSRILWTFSAVYNSFKSEEELNIADRAFNYILENFVDPTHGGVYWMVDFKGMPVQPKKQIYGQVFTIYGLTEYYKASGNLEALELAKNIFYLVEKYAFDQVENGYIEALDQDWQELDDVRLSEKDLNAHKTMNTHLHILEAYTNLFRFWPAEQLRIQLKNLIEVMIQKFVNVHNHFNLFFDKDWTLLSDEISFGHDIEGSWLLYEAAEVLNDQDTLERVEPITINMVKAASEGLDRDGALMNEGRVTGLTDTDKHWWPQAEALVGFINAWQLTDDTTFMTKAINVWDFIMNNLIDFKHGEWHWKIKRDGSQDYSEDKAGPWKCPYHNSRALIELIDRLP